MIGNQSQAHSEAYQLEIAIPGFTRAEGLRVCLVTPKRTSKSMPS